MPHLVLDVGNFCLKSLGGLVKFNDLRFNYFEVITLSPGSNLELLALGPGKGKSEKVAWEEPIPGFSPQTSEPPAQSGLLVKTNL